MRFKLLKIFWGREKVELVGYEIGIANHESILKHIIPNTFFGVIEKNKVYIDSYRRLGIVRYILYIREHLRWQCKMRPIGNQNFPPNFSSFLTIFFPMNEQERPMRALQLVFIFL